MKVDHGVLARLSGRIERELAERSAKIYELAGESFNINSPQAAVRDPVREAEAAGAQADREDQASPRRLGGSARRAGAGARAAAPDPRVAQPSEAEGHLHRRAAAAGRPRHRPGAHVVQPGGRGDGAVEQQRAEPAEHPDPHRARAGDPRGVRRRAGPRAHLGRLLADRAAGARAPVRRRRADRGVPARRGHPRSDRAARYSAPTAGSTRTSCGGGRRSSTTRCSTERPRSRSRRTSA